jgi:uncharacterized protein (TIGR03435 family)
MMMRTLPTEFRVTNIPLRLIIDAVRELGLKLESERGPVEHLVIDSVERPSEN